MDLKLKNPEFLQLLTEMQTMEQMLATMRLRVEALADGIEYAPDIIIRQPSVIGAQAGGLRKMKEELAAVFTKTVAETSALNWFFIAVFSILTAFGIHVVAGFNVNAITAGGTGFAMIIQALLSWFFPVHLFALILCVNLVLLTLSAAKERQYSFTGRSFVTILVINGVLALFYFLPVVDVSAIPTFVGVAIAAIGGIVAFGKGIYCFFRKQENEIADESKAKELKLRRWLRFIVDVILMPIIFVFAIYFTGAYHVALLGLAAFGIGGGIGAINSIAYAKGSTSTGGTDTCANILASKFGGHPMLWMRGIDLVILLMGALVMYANGSALSGVSLFVNSCLLVILYGVYAESAKDLLVKLQEKILKK